MASPTDLDAFNAKIDQYVARVKSHTIAAGIFDYETISADYAIKVVEKVAQVARSAIEYAKSLEKIIEINNAGRQSITKSVQQAIAPLGTSGGRNKLYQAMVMRDYEQANQLVKTQPHLVAEIEPQWKADVLYDFIMTAEKAQNIIWLVEIFGFEAVKELFCHSQYEFLSNLLKPDYVEVLKKLRHMGVLGKQEQAELEAKSEALADIVKMVFDDE